MQRQRFLKHCKQNFKLHSETFNIKSNGINPIGASIHTLADNPNAHLCNSSQTPSKPFDLRFLQKGRCFGSSPPRWRLIQNRRTSPQRSDPRNHLTHDSFLLIHNTPCAVPLWVPNRKHPILVKPIWFLPLAFSGTPLFCEKFLRNPESCRFVSFFKKKGIPFPKTIF